MHTDQPVMIPLPDQPEMLPSPDQPEMLTPLSICLRRANGEGLGVRPVPIPRSVAIATEAITGFASARVLIQAPVEVQAFEDKFDSGGDGGRVAVTIEFGDRFF